LIQQLRIYEIFERNKVAFHARFRDHAMRIMRKDGFEVLALWEAKTDRRTELVYLLNWPDEASKEAVGEIEDRVLMSTVYSPRPFASLTR